MYFKKKPHKDNIYITQDFNPGKTIMNDELTINNQRTVIINQIKCIFKKHPINIIFICPRISIRGHLHTIFQPKSGTYIDTKF